MRAIKALIDEYNEKQAAKFEEDLFKQRKRLADAERCLQTKPTNKAQDDQRTATDKVRQLMGRHADFERTELRDRDSRISPGWYVPVMIWEDGKRAIKPMRYGCRPAGKPAFYDVKYPGTYNARRDNLQGFWKNQFGQTHGLIVVNAFYENVNRHKAEGREVAPGGVPENLVLEFKTRPRQDMLIACPWSKWTGTGESVLLSITAITDEPPAKSRQRATIAASSPSSQGISTNGWIPARRTRSGSLRTSTTASDPTTSTVWRLEAIEPG